LQSQEGELEKCHASDYSGIPDFLQFAATAAQAGVPPFPGPTGQARHAQTTPRPHAKTAARRLPFDG
jgi:hypothetical protein